MSDPYWDTHVRSVIRLQELGYKYKLQDRLPIFKLWRELYKMGRQSPKLRPAIGRIMEDLDYLKALRCEGLEPELKSPTRYKDGA
jgi:hypothetical protein